MLNPFPVQFLALFAYFFLRVCVGALLITLGIQHLKARSSLIETTRWPLLPHHSFPITALIVTEILLGLMFIVGWYTQYAALGLLLLCIKLIIWRNRFNHPTIPNRMFFLLLGAAALSLFITGAGVLAFDLPI